MAIPFKSLRFPPAGARARGECRSCGNPGEKRAGVLAGDHPAHQQLYEAVRGPAGPGRRVAGRNIQLIPYGTFTGARFLDRSAAAYDTEKDGRAGVDAKIVARDSLTFDFTLNPDFSQVESDEPQVTVNQRFEVFFPEKRPFFLENSGYFQTR